jgi:polysaccharide biosynthesis transport protein
MLNRLGVDFDRQTEGAQYHALEPIDLVGVTLTLWRNLKMILGVAMVFALIALVYCQTTPKLYTASASILIGPRQPTILNEQQTLVNEQIEAAQVDSQVEILKSERVLLRVVKGLKLTDDPEFTGQQDNFFRYIVRYLTFSPGSVNTVQKIERTAMGNLLAALNVKRIGLTYVLSISITTVSGEKSAKIANAVAEAYLQDSMEVREETANKSASWLRDRVKDLRDSAVLADTRVQDYKENNNIVASAKGSITDQRVSEISTQLTAARAQLGEIQAKFDRISAITSSGNDRNSAIEDAVVTDALANNVIVKLRASYFENAARIADLTKRYGADNVSTEKLRSENRSLQASMIVELRRIGESYKSDLEITKKRVESLQKSMDDAVSGSLVSDRAQVALRDLEREAEAYRAIYQTSLLRLHETTQQQSFPLSEARIITTSAPPSQKSWPKTTMTLALAALAGLAAGGIVSVLRETLNRPIRNRSDITRLPGGRCIATVPSISTDAVISKLHEQKKQKSKPGPLSLASIARRVLVTPSSAFSGSIRSIKNSLYQETSIDQHAVIGFISTSRGEGRTVLAANVALSLAMSGRHTLLIDADFRKPDLSAILAQQSRIGLATILAKQAVFEEARLVDETTGLHFLPSGMVDSIPNFDELLGSAITDEVLEQLRKVYEIVVVDLPPMDLSADAIAVAPSLDGFIYVIESGKTGSRAVTDAVESADAVNQRILGYALNKVKFSGGNVMRTFGIHQSRAAS